MMVVRIISSWNIWTKSIFSIQWYNNVQTAIGAVVTVIVW